VLAAASKLAGPEIIIASTTSTILVDDISSAVEHPRRFLNVHWLNPAYLIPLVELVARRRYRSRDHRAVKHCSEGIGKVPACARRPRLHRAANSGAGP